MKDKIKNSLNSMRLNNKLMQKVKGGDCRCGCLYANSGGSSTVNNFYANKDFPGGPLHSPMPDN